MIDSCHKRLQTVECHLYEILEKTNWSVVIESVSVIYRSWGYFRGGWERYWLRWLHTFVKIQQSVSLKQVPCMSLCQWYVNKIGLCFEKSYPCLHLHVVCFFFFPLFLAKLLWKFPTLMELQEKRYLPNAYRRWREEGLRDCCDIQCSCPNFTTERDSMIVNFMCRLGWASILRYLVKMF